MKAYGHLTYEEREHIALLRVEGLCPSQIAQEIGRPPCTVGRELKRNSNGDGGYRPMSAEGRYLARRHRDRILDADPALATFVRERLYEGWTPEQRSASRPSMIGCTARHKSQRSYGNSCRGSGLNEAVARDAGRVTPLPVAAPSMTVLKTWTGAKPRITGREI